MNILLIAISVFTGILSIITIVFTAIFLNKQKNLLTIFFAILSFVFLSISTLSLFLIFTNQKNKQKKYGVINYEKNEIENINPINSDLYEDPTEFEDGTIYPDTIPDPELMGFTENETYNFSIFTDSYAPDIIEVENSVDWAINSYNYCIPLVHITNKDQICGENKYNLFNISVLSEEQYQKEVIDNPLGGTYTLLGEKDGNYFVFSHPNGDIPVELKMPETFYDDLIVSFTFID